MFITEIDVVDHEEVCGEETSDENEKSDNESSDEETEDEQDNVNPSSLNSVDCQQPSSTNQEDLVFVMSDVDFLSECANDHKNEVTLQNAELHTDDINQTDTNVDDRTLSQAENAEHVFDLQTESYEGDNTEDFIHTENEIEELIHLDNCANAIVDDLEDVSDAFSVLPGI